MRSNRPSMNHLAFLEQGLVYLVISTSTGPMVMRLPGTTSDQSSPEIVMFSPVAPGVTECPSACNFSITSSEKRHRA